MTAPTDTPIKFPEKREKWEKWIAERIDAENLAEPLYVFVDDEPEQLSNRYYECRRQNIPGRNILLFRNAEESIEFINFAKEHNLYLAAVVADYDNGKVSTTTGTDIMQAVDVYHESWDHQMAKVVISSGDRTQQVNLLNLKLENDVINSYAHEPDQSGLPADLAKARVSFVHKDTLFDMHAQLPRTPTTQQEANTKESTTLIPDLIYGLEMVTALTERFRNVLKPYRDLKLNPENPDSPKVKDVYDDTWKALKRGARRMEDMVKMWVMLKDYEFQLEAKNGFTVPNPDSEEPEEALNVRILGTFFLQELKTVQESLVACEQQCDLFRFSELREAMRNDKTIDVSAYKKPDNTWEMAREDFISHVAHNLQNPFGNIRTTLLELAGGSKVDGVLPKFLKAAHSTVIWEPAMPGEHRFDHKDHLEMAHNYLETLSTLKKGDIPPPIFYYSSASKSAPRRGEGEGRTTRDRTENTPGESAPKRKTINIPHNDEEREHIINQIMENVKETAKPIKKSMIRRYIALVELDMRLSQQVTSAGMDNPQEQFTALANILLAETNKMRADGGWSRAGEKPQKQKHNDRDDKDHGHKKHKKKDD